MSTENNIENEISEAAETVQEETATAAEEASAEVREAAEEAADSAEDAVKDAVEAVEDAAENTAETAEDAVEEAAETAEDAAENAAETVEDAAEEAVEKAEETAEEVKEAADEAASTVKENVTAAETKAKTPKAAPVIKKKKGINTTTLIVIIVCAVVVLLAAAYAIGAATGILVQKSNGWFWFPSKASYTIAPHDTIEISESDVTVTDANIDNYITYFQEAYTTTDEVTEGTVEDGDTVYISYEGKIDGVAFDGGTSDGYELTIGSGTFIDGFEDGLIGVEVGETVDLNLTFPEDYSSEELAGQDVVFTVTVIHKDVSVTPEFTDDFVKENSADYTLTRFGESVQLDTVSDYTVYVKDYLKDSYLTSALEDALKGLIEVRSYDETNYNLLYEYSAETLAYYASYYGMDTDTLASYYGFESTDDYLKNDTEDQLKLAMLYSDLAKEIGITHTAEDVDASITEYMEDNGLTETYTLEDFKSLNGEAWLYIYENYQMNYDPVIEAMKERVVLVESAEEETEETTATAE